MNTEPNPPENSSRHLERIYTILQTLIGLHRQLHDVCRDERQALVNADVRLIQEKIHAKELIIETIKQSESQRIRVSIELADEWNQPLEFLTLGNIIMEVEPTNAELAQRFRSSMNALKILIQRAKDVNDSNRALVAKSMQHVNQMKDNVLGEAIPRSDTYGSTGQKTNNTAGARLISKEA